MVKKILIIVMAMFLSIISFELFLRYSPFSYGVSPVLYDKDIGMWHKKNFSSYAIKECYNTKYFFDENGLVDINYIYNDERKDVLILGDSFTEAIMVKNKNILHNSLWKEFKGKYNFLNYGLSGTSPTQQYMILVKKANLNNVKTILQIINIDSDLYDVDPKNIDSFSRPKVAIKFISVEDYFIIPPRKQGLKDKIIDIIGSYQIYVPLKKSIYFLKKEVKKFISNNKIKEKKTIGKKMVNLAQNWLQIEGAIYQTKKLLKSKGIEYIVIINSEKKDNIEQLVKILHRYSIPFLNLYDLTSHHILTLPSFSCDKHWNDEAHINLAKYIFKSGIIK